jgi:hypothetical protein
MGTLGTEANMAISIRQLAIGIAAAVAMTAVGISVIGVAAALAPATERAQAGVLDFRRHESHAFAGRFSDHQQLRRIFIDEARERLR